MVVVVLVITKMFLFVVVIRIDRQVMLVEMKHAHHEKHEQQTAKANA